MLRVHPPALDWRSLLRESHFCGLPELPTQFACSAEGKSQIDVPDVFLGRIVGLLPAEGLADLRRVREYGHEQALPGSH